MKKLLPLIFVLFAHIAFSQNWAPVNLNSKYNYKVDTANYITNTIWVDSVEVVSGDSVFYLNRIVRYANDSCYGNVPSADCYAWKNQPQFLQRKVTKQANGNYHFSDSLSFVLNINAQLNDTWLFDTLNSVTATVMAVTEETILGNLDSVKTIVLSNADTISLSKSYGILRFFDQNYQGVKYTLVGTEDPDLGEIVPGFWEMYDYEVGGSFCSISNYTHAGDGIFDTYTTRSKILNKSINGNTVVYDTEGHRMLEDYTWSQGTYIVWINNYNYSYEFVNTPDAMFNGYNYQLVQLPNSLYHYCVLQKLTDGRYKKVIGGYNPGYSTSFVLSDSVPDLLLPYCCSPQNQFDLSFEQWNFEEGQGLVDRNSTVNFEGSSRYTFNYNPDASDTSDFCIPYQLVGLEEQPQAKLSITPNPATDRVQLTFTQPINGDIILYNQTGQVVLNEAISNSVKQELNVSHLPAGLYLLNVRGEKQSVFEKLIISR